LVTDPFGTPIVHFFAVLIGCVEGYSLELCCIIHHDSLHNILLAETATYFGLMNCSSLSECQISMDLE